MVAKRAAATAKGTEARLALNISSTVMTRLLISSHSPIFLHIRERFPLSKGQKKRPHPLRWHLFIPDELSLVVEKMGFEPTTCALDGLHYTKNRSLCQTLDPLGAQSLP